MSHPNSTHHSIDYIEFSVLNIEDTKNFFSSAFDWKFTDYAPEYVGIKNPNGVGEIGGFSLEKAIQTGGPLVVLYSKDLEKSLTLVTEAGGKICKDIFEFPGGRRFEFTDPSGNKLAVWSQKPSN